MGTISLSLPSDGQTIDASDVNNPFNTIATEINGNLDNANIKAGAAIDRSKISGFTDGWEALGYTPTTITNNGNRSYDVLIPSVNLTSNLSPGMRLKLTRTVTAPTGSITLNGTSQYANKTSPAGMTFTDDFTVSAWIKLTAYQIGGIVSRRDGTQGWQFNVNASGQLELKGFNANLANVSTVTSYQSIPLNKWVHVAAQLDMSTFTSTTTTSYTMIDGVDVPASVSRGGTNPTALVQAGNLEVGSVAAANFFPGQIAQVAIYSAKVTQATLKASMNQTLTGSETSLISAYKLDQASGLTDLNANANNLTAQGSPSYSTTATPFTQDVTNTSITAGTTNYAIVTKAVFSTNTTLTVQVPEGETIPTSGGVSAVSYSTQKTPYGFPAQRGKWWVYYIALANNTQSSPTQSTWYNFASMTMPVGEWVTTYESAPYYTKTGNSLAMSIWGTLSTSASTESDKRMTVRTYISVNSAVNGETINGVNRQGDYSLSSATVYYLNFYTDTASVTTIGTISSQHPTRIIAELAYL